VPSGPDDAGRGARVGLLCTAAIVGGSLAALGAGFSAMAEPESRRRVDHRLLARDRRAPLGPDVGPAIVPRRHAVAARIARWMGAALLVLPIALFGVARWRDGAAPAAPALGLGAVTVGACAVSLSLLLWPDLRARLSRDRAG